VPSAFRNAPTGVRLLRDPRPSGGGGVSGRAHPAPFFWPPGVGLPLPGVAKKGPGLHPPGQGSGGGGGSSERALGSSSGHPRGPSGRRRTPGASTMGTSPGGCAGFPALCRLRPRGGGGVTPFLQAPHLRNHREGCVGMSNVTFCFFSFSFSFFQAPREDFVQVVDGVNCFPVATPPEFVCPFTLWRCKCRCKCTNNVSSYAGSNMRSSSEPQG